MEAPALLLHAPPMAGMEVMDPLQMSPPDTANGNSNSSSEAPNATLTIRMIMQGKEAGSIIGKKGDNVKRFREESGAKINISDSSCPERIVTVTGTTDGIFKAFSMVCKKFEEDINNTHNSSLPKPPVTVRLIVPASQCGSLIGKGGSKIKEIREVTGASIQVASEMLPNSTERTVTISGNAESITQCIYHICCVMLEVSDPLIALPVLDVLLETPPFKSPPKGATIPYRPKPAVPPVIFTANGQAIAVAPGAPPAGAPFVPSSQQDPSTSGALPGPPMMMGPFGPMLPAGIQAALPPGPPMVPQGHPQAAKIAAQQGLLQTGVIPFAQQALIPGIMGLGGIPRPGIPGAQIGQQSHEMTIPNDLIGCIIGRGGAKINEIRQLSGATIKIANSEEGSSDRKVTIMGTLETINAAQYLIQASIEMHKLTLDPATLGGAPSAVAPPPAGASPTSAAAAASLGFVPASVSPVAQQPQPSLPGNAAGLQPSMTLPAGLQPHPFHVTKLLPSGGGGGGGAGHMAHLLALQGLTAGAGGGMLDAQALLAAQRHSAALLQAQQQQHGQHAVALQPQQQQQGQQQQVVQSVAQQRHLAAAAQVATPAITTSKLQTVNGPAKKPERAKYAPY